MAAAGTKSMKVKCEMAKSDFARGWLWSTLYQDDWPVPLFDLLLIIPSVFLQELNVILGQGVRDLLALLLVFPSLSCCIRNLSSGHRYLNWASPLLDPESLGMMMIVEWLLSAIHALKVFRGWQFCVNCSISPSMLLLIVDRGNCSVT